jgi:hypothetical protein
MIFGKRNKYDPRFLEALSHYTVVRYYGGQGIRNRWQIRYDGNPWTSDLDHLDGQWSSERATKRGAMNQARRFALRDAMDSRFADKVKPAGEIGRIPNKDMRSICW